MADETTSSPKLAPEYALHRVVKEANEAAPYAVREKGINMASHSHAHIQVVPEGTGCNPNVAVYWWSEKAAKFIQEHTAITKAGAGVLVPYEFTVECRGRIMLVAVEGGMAAGRTARIYVAGYNVERV